MELWIATGNRGKLREFERLFQDQPFEIKSLKDFPAFTPPEENGQTFVENARIKAKSFSAIKKGHWVLGEDSGLEAEGLNNFPGIHSARYAGNNASDMENMTKLLKMLTLRTNNRNATFKCTLIAYSPEGQEHIFEGELKGTISKTLKGTQGFGYDPVFIPEGMEKTMAELTPGEKIQISHRAKAANQFLDFIKDKI